MEIVQMLNSAQIRAARALVRWSAQELAERSGVGISTVQRMENAEGVPSASGKNLEAVQRALEAAGVEFIPENGGGAGVRLRERTIEGDAKGPTFEILPLKAGAGFFVRITPAGYGPTEDSPAFPSEAEAKSWLEKERRKRNIGR